ncbi:MAG: aminotransferase class V-fold PLP-dependent enzyme [Actinomycetes bacterium]
MADLTVEQIDEMLAQFYPYRDRFEAYRRIPESGRPRAEVLDLVTTLAHEEDALGDSGKVSGSLYLGDHDQYHFLTQVYEAFAHANVLQRDMYPSSTKFEGEIVAMAAAMLHADPIGVITSGGTESLMNPMLVYRERGRVEKGITEPEVIMPASAHVAIDKAAHYFGIKLLKAPLTEQYVVDVGWVRDHVTPSTVALVGSAGSYPYGLVDPIEELSSIALEHDLGLHVDGCLGGFLLPWGDRLGYPIPAFDFRVEGVTSMSADTHKFGYALKGTSVLLYRDRDLRRYQYFAASDWPGGLYVSPGMSGSRSGGLIAATWAAMVTTGEQGYLDAASRIFATARRIRDAVEATEGLAVCGDPTFLIGFTSSDPDVDIYLVNDYLISRGWRMNPNQRPPGLHFCVTLPNTREGLADEFAVDLADGVDYARSQAGQPARSGALYGLAGTPAGEQMLPMLLAGALDAMYDVPPSEDPDA